MSSNLPENYFIDFVSSMSDLFQCGMHAVAPSLWIVYTGVAIAICFRRYLLCVGGVVVLIGNIALNSFPLGFISISALTELFFQWATCHEVNSFIAEEESVNGSRRARLADEPFPASSQAYNAL